MGTFRISGHFTVGDLSLKPGPERERRIIEIEKILNEGLSRCTSIDRFFVARQMRPWNETRRDGLTEPDVVEEVTISGPDREAVFTTSPRTVYSRRLMEPMSPTRTTPE